MSDKISAWENLIMDEAAKVGGEFHNNDDLDCGTHAEAFGMGAGFATKNILEWMVAYCSRDGSDEFAPPLATDAGSDSSAWEMFEAFNEYITK